MHKLSIGVITFHWAANHGAVLQAYASLKYLLKQEKVEKVEIINYLPAGSKTSILSLLKPAKPYVMAEKLKNYRKGKKIDKFRDHYLITSKQYCSEEEMVTDPPQYDLVFCGSDQIWNPYFTLHGEGHKTGSYFLSFVPEKTVRASLSASFGCDDYPVEAQEYIKPLLEKFDYLSVREKTGVSILKRMNYHDVINVADPTSLLEQNDYLQFVSHGINNEKYIAKCILRKQNRENRALVSRIEKQTKCTHIHDIAYESIEQWLTEIYNSELVITNSFHCVMMCLFFHKPFFVLLEQGTRAGMNDRLLTLLSFFDLDNRIIDHSTSIQNNSLICWNEVDKTMKQYKKTLTNYLNRVITETADE